MNIEKMHDKIRYTLSNDNLMLYDKVYPIGRGRCLDDGKWILHNLDFSEFPDEPHIILNLKHSDYKPYEVRTNLGFSPIECYFKIIKMEKQTVESKGIFTTYKWIDITPIKD